MNVKNNYPYLLIHLLNTIAYSSMSVLALTSQLTFGRGLGDLVYFLLIWIITLFLIVVSGLILLKKNSISSLFFKSQTIFALFILLFLTWILIYDLGPEAGGIALRTPLTLR